MIFTLAGEPPRTLEVRRESNGYAIVEAGHEIKVDAQAVAAGWWSLLIGARSYDASITRDGSTYTVEIEGERFEFELTDPSRAILGRQDGPRRGTGEIHAPMPGRVIRILAQPGQKVRQGEGIVVVEAMKMENELAAPRDGTVTEIAVTEGQTVEGGILLVRIDSHE